MSENELERAGTNLERAGTNWNGMEQDVATKDLALEGVRSVSCNGSC